MTFDPTFGEAARHRERLHVLFVRDTQPITSLSDGTKAWSIFDRANPGTARVGALITRAGQRDRWYLGQRVLDDNDIAVLVGVPAAARALTIELFVGGTPMPDAAATANRLT